MLDLMLYGHHVPDVNAAGPQLVRFSPVLEPAMEEPLAEEHQA